MPSVADVYVWAAEVMRAEAVVSLDEALGAVLALLAGDDVMADASRDALALGYTRFVRTLKTCGVSTFDEVTVELVDRFLDAPVRRHGKRIRPTASTVKNRRSTVRSFYQACRSLHLTSNDFAPRRAPVSRPETGWSRPLDDGEISRCRTHAANRLFGDRGPAVLALCEAGGTFSELALVTIGDLDLEAGTVRFGESARRAGRRNHLTPWGAKVLRARVEELGTGLDTPLVVGRGTRGASAGASLSQATAKILRRAGIAGDGVAPDSIRAWSAVQVWRSTGQVEAVARWLGSRSLDAAARTIGYAWQGENG